jgi:hypothetical protein
VQEKIGRWAFLLGILVSVAAGFMDLGSLGIGLLAALGLVVGLLNVTGKEVQRFLIGTVALMLVGTAGINIVASFGGFIANIVSAFTAFVAGAAFIVALREVYSVSKDK